MKISTIIAFLLLPSFCFGKVVGEASFTDKRNDISVDDYQEEFFDIRKVKVTYNGSNKLWFEFEMSGEMPEPLRDLSRFIIWFDLDDNIDTGVNRDDIGMDIAAFITKASEVHDWLGRVANYSKFGMNYEIDVTQFKFEENKVFMEITSNRFENGDTFKLIFETKTDKAALDDLGPVEIKLRNEG